METEEDYKARINKAISDWYSKFDKPSKKKLSLREQRKVKRHFIKRQARLAK